METMSTTKATDTTTTIMTVRNVLLGFPAKVNHKYVFIRKF